MDGKIGTAQLLAALKAAGESTRLRILALLARREHNVSDLTSILEQSQPRISRHLRLLAEAKLIERFKEGSFVYCRLAADDETGALVSRAIALLDPADSVVKADANRAEHLQRQREKVSQSWFQDNAAEWDRIRSLHVPEGEVEAEMLQMIGDGPIDLLMDLGTGTGRALELFAGRARQLIGVDASHSMLEYARSRLQGEAFAHCQLRHGNLTDLAYEDGVADAVLLHQVLHYVMEPGRAVREAARLLKPGGKLLVVDFAPHDLDFLREEFQHERLGFSHEQIDGWMKKAGIVPGERRQLTGAGAENERQLTVSLWLGVREGAGSSRELALSARSTE